MSSDPPRSFKSLLLIVGPGIVVAATGVGAGDLVAAAKAGALYGSAVLWAAALGAVIKFALAEGIARWQLATGTTILEGWVRTFGRPVRILFLVYLVFWTVMVAAALMAACGLGANALLPFLSVEAWAVLHGLFALTFVWFRGYGSLERAMKAAIGVMFLAILGSAAVQAPSLGKIARGLVIPAVPEGSAVLLLGIIGGVGGTVTLLSYNYWIREKGWTGRAWIRGMRFDLAVGYGLTGIFGLALVILAGEVLLPKGYTVSGSEGALQLADMLGDRFGRAGELVFLVGFWAAVGTSLLGVWQGVPYLFGDYVGLLRGGSDAARERAVSRKGRCYRGYALFMTFIPMPLLFLGRPVALIVWYAAFGSLFMAFLAATLLYMNNRKKKMGDLTNGFLSNAALVTALLLFAYLAVIKLG